MSEQIREVTGRIALQYAEELKALFAHDRFPEILQGLYLYDETVPKPSRGAIVFLGLTILANPAIMKELDDISSEISLTEGFVLVAERFKDFPDEELAANAALASRQYLESSLSNPNWELGLLEAEWSIFIKTFRDATTWIERIVSHQIIERLVSLSIFEGHVPSLDGLASITDTLTFGDSGNSTTPQKIARFILSNESILKRELTWKPSKSAIKYFILALEPDLTSNDTEWSKAWKIIGQVNIADRSGSRLNQAKKDELTALARIPRSRN